MNLFSLACPSFSLTVFLKPDFSRLFNYNILGIPRMMVMVYKNN